MARHAVILSLVDLSIVHRVCQKQAKHIHTSLLKHNTALKNPSKETLKSQEINGQNPYFDYCKTHPA